MLFVDGIFEHAFVLLDFNIHSHSLGFLSNLYMDTGLMFGMSLLYS